LRIEEQETSLNLHEHDDDDEDTYPKFLLYTTDDEPKQELRN